MSERRRTRFERALVSLDVRVHNSPGLEIKTEADMGISTVDEPLYFSNHGGGREGFPQCRVQRRKGIQAGVRARYARKTS